MEQVYQHYKSGDLYRVLAEGKLEEDGEDVVIYQSLHIDKPQIWVRRTAVFHESIFLWVHGKEVPRFRLVSPSELSEMVRASQRMQEESTLTTPWKKVEVPKDSNIAGINPRYHKATE